VVSDAGLDAALASPRQHQAYAKPDVFDLAAQRAFALTSNHPFRDGNKRVALTVAGVFLEMNGFHLEAPEAEAVNAMLALSTRALDADGFAAWLRRHSSRPRSRSKRRPVRKSAPPSRAPTPKRIKRGK